MVLCELGESFQLLSGVSLLGEQKLVLDVLLVVPSLSLARLTSVNRDFVGVKSLEAFRVVHQEAQGFHAHIQRGIWVKHDLIHNIELIAGNLVQESLSNTRAKQMLVALLLSSPAKLASQRVRQPQEGILTFA